MDFPFLTSPALSARSLSEPETVTRSRVRVGEIPDKEIWLSSGESAGQGREGDGPRERETALGVCLVEMCTNTAQLSLGSLQSP